MGNDIFKFMFIAILIMNVGFKFVEKNMCTFRHKLLFRLKTKLDYQIGLEPLKTRYLYFAVRH